MKTAKTYRPLIEIFKKAGFNEFVVNWEHGIQTVLDKEIHEYSYLTYRALGLHYDTPRETAAKYHNRPRCKSMNHALLEKTTFSKDIDRVVAKHRGDVLDTCAGHGVFKKTCIERAFGSVSPGSVKKIDEYDIKVKGALSKNEVVRVLRQRTPGLRHVYNKFLKKKNPNFEGLVKLKLVVNSSGEVDSVSVVHSTTGFEEFDEEIKTAVGRYKFPKVDSGNTAIEIPFEFALNENAKDAK